MRALAESGERSGLPGEGRPFASEDLGGDEARWAAFRLVKNNRLIPGVVQARIEIDGALARLRTRARALPDLARTAASAARQAPGRSGLADAVRVTEREDKRVRAEMEDAVGALNAHLDRYNALVPAEDLRLGRFSAAALLASAP